MVVTAIQCWGKILQRVLNFDFESGHGESLGGPLTKEMARSYLGGDEQNFTCWRREGTKNSRIKGTSKQAETVQFWYLF